MSGSYANEEAVTTDGTNMLLNAPIDSIVDAWIATFPEEGTYNANITLSSTTTEDIRDAIDFAAILYFKASYQYSNLRKADIFVDNDKHATILDANVRLYRKWLQESDFECGGRMTDSGKNRLLQKVHEATKIYREDLSQ